ncbi:MAG: oligopeptide transporter permease protein [Aeromicrobium sp.]|nr:oligopeptide transporter permease protein [Aeromicrobium sp.]
MRRLLAKRMLMIVPLLLIVSFMVFGLVLLVPGDPAVTLAGPNATAEQIAHVRVSLGLNDAVWVQYGRWAGDALHGDLGRSLFSGRSVSQSIGERLPVTVSLAGLSLVVALIIAVPAGIIAAVNRGRWIDSAATIGATLGLAMPSFFLGLVLVLIFALKLRWLPATGYQSVADGGLTGWARHLVLPALTLGAAAAAETTRQLRASLGDVLQQDYIRTARAKGLRTHVIILKHALKNAVVTVVTVLGFQVALLLGGSVIVEQLFALIGLGGLAIRAVLDRDLPVIQGVVMFSAVIVIVVNVAVDLLYGCVNPKIRGA